MDFRERLQQAAQRGARARAEREFAEAAEALSEEECRRRHSQHRLALSEHIEKCVAGLADSFPGFRLETIVDEKGWGAGVSRDDLRVSRGKRDNYFSRLRVVVEPYNEYQVMSVTAKGAVRNKETFTRTHFEPIGEFEEAKFRGLIEQWVLEYAELYAAS